MVFIDFQPFRAVGKIIGYNDFVFILQITVILDFLLLQKIMRIFLVVGYDTAVKELRSIFEMYDANHRSFPSAVSRPAFSSSYWMVVTPIPFSYIAA